MSSENIIEETSPLLPLTALYNEGIEIPNVINTGRLGSWFPFGFFYELRKLVKLAVPIALTSLTNYLFGPISVMFCGHLGSLELATVGLAISVFNVTGLAVAMGLLTACDTLFAQIYGSNELDKMGLNLQKSMLLMTLCCLPCWSLHLVMEPILLGLKQNPLIAKHATFYLTCMMPSLFFGSMGQIFTKYVQAQNHVIPALVIGALSNLLNAFLHYLLLYKTNIGINGSALAQFFAYLFQTVAFIAYTKWHRMARITWNNYSTRLWEDWGLWFRLAVPGLFMITLEWTIFEIGSIIAGILGEKELAAQTIIYNVESMCYTLLPLGIGLASSIRVGHFLGARCSIGPKSVTSVGLVTACILSIPMIMLFVLLRSVIPYIFTQDRNIIDLTSNLFPILAVFQLFDNIVGVSSGIIRGAGLQYVGATICIVTLYIIGAPLGVCLIFFAHMGLEGLWWGLCVGIILSAVIYVTTILRLDWANQVYLATKRVKSVDASVFHKPSVYMSVTSHEESGTTSIQNSQESIKPARPSNDLSRDLTTGNIAMVQVKTENTSVLRIRDRALLIIAFSAMFVVCLTCRCTLHWSKYFGFYCIYPNGTFLSLSNQTQADDLAFITNCTVFQP
ncbi:Multidrug and toxin extrusion protein [Paragonimus heterotremus]|uniref:Multidrug and toxin extrusion protein n=1 Tax=Paragonimus heterotremus TaxID=100268 RepID=A0A8J4SNZ0_9TREM|nr:Multidrug and toxin extrusion protein [Paragonimus heterotremus]